MQHNSIEMLYRFSLAPNAHFLCPFWLWVAGFSMPIFPAQPSGVRLAWGSYFYWVASYLFLRQLINTAFISHGSHQHETLNCPESFSASFLFLPRYFPIPPDPSPTVCLSSGLCWPVCLKWCRGILGSGLFLALLHANFHA